nr:MAG TPA: hypothetical protein [Caudoviricetes sp.]
MHPVQPIRGRGEPSRWAYTEGERCIFFARQNPKWQPKTGSTPPDVGYPTTHHTHIYIGEGGDISTPSCLSKIW